MLGVSDVMLPGDCWRAESMIDDCGSVVGCDRRNAKRGLLVGATLVRGWGNCLTSPSKDLGGFDLPVTGRGDC